MCPVNNMFPNSTVSKNILVLNRDVKAIRVLRPVE